LTYAISDPSGNSASTNRTVLVMAKPPTITGQPQGRVVQPQSSVSLSVTAGGSPPLTYQWRHNGVNLNGASLSTLLLQNVQATNTGGYDVVVTNAFGSITSAVAFL